MNSETYRRILEIFPNNDVCAFAEKLCEKFGVNPSKDFPQSVDSMVMKSAARKALYTNWTVDLLRRAVFLGGNSGDLLCISEHLLVIMDSIDKSLDYVKSEEFNHIKDLDKKYSKQEFFSLDIPIESYERSLKSTKEYFEGVQANAGKEDYE